MDKLTTFKKLNKLFNDNGFNLFLVGGTVRDFLLNVPLTDMDGVTDATPDQIASFLMGDFTFAKMGSVKIKYDDVKFDITTLRKEKNYKDFRHPGEIQFVKSPKEEVMRRDFTINALYLDEHFRVLDYVNGIEDLNNKAIRVIGNPDKRFVEDPLRIIRAIRFALTFDFDIERKTAESMKRNSHLVKKLSKGKIEMELKKFKNISNDKMKEYFELFSIKHLLDVID